MRAAMIEDLVPCRPDLYKHLHQYVRIWLFWRRREGIPI